MRQFYVYILANFSGTTLYTGMTNDLERRLYEHKNKLVRGFASRYHIDRLVYYECFKYVNDAIKREKEIKAWRREKNDALIRDQNPDWRDLSNEILSDDYGIA